MENLNDQYDFNKINNYSTFMCFREDESVVMTFFCTLVLCMNVYILFESKKKYRWIREPKMTQSRDWDQTYCYLSLTMVRWVQILITLSIIYLFI